MVEELLAARGIIVIHETVRQWARKFVQQFANRIRRRLPRIGDKWHLDEVVLKIAGVKHWLWGRAVDQTGIVLDVLVQRRRDKQAAKRLLRKLLKKQMRPPRVIITDKLERHGPHRLRFGTISKMLFMLRLHFRCKARVNRAKVDLVALLLEGLEAEPVIALAQVCSGLNGLGDRDRHSRSGARSSSFLARYVVPPTADFLEPGLGVEDGSLSHGSPSWIVGMIRLCRLRSSLAGSVMLEALLGCRGVRLVTQAIEDRFDQTIEDRFERIAVRSTFLVSSLSFHGNGA
jgi:hypothetical protein